MIDRSLLYYLDTAHGDLLPDSEQTTLINDEDWYLALQPHFNDLIWLYYSDRTVFINNRFKCDDSDITTINNIKRSFAINLKTKNYEYGNLYNSTVLEFNPLWNVDGVEGTIREYTTNSEGTDAHSGSDVDTGSHSYNKTNSNTRTIEKENDDTRSETKKATYDSGNTYYPVEENTTVHGTLGNPLETIEDSGSISDGGTDSLAHNYNSQRDTVDSTTHKELELNIRQGNIGVTKSTDLIDSYRETAMFDFFKKVVRDCVNTCTYAVE